MPFASKSQQRAARSTGVVAADRIVTSNNKPELQHMPQDKSDLKGGRMSGTTGGRNGPTKLFGSMDVKAKSSGLFGPLNKADGSSTGRNGRGLTSDSTYKNPGTTREKLGGKQADGS